MARPGVADVLELDAACELYRRFCNETRPHEALHFAVPLARYLSERPWPPPEPHLSEAESVHTS
jgi:hypothetical protein